MREDESLGPGVQRGGTGCVLNSEPVVFANSSELGYERGGKVGQQVQGLSHCRKGVATNWSRRSHVWEKQGCTRDPVWFQLLGSEFT